LILAEVFLWLTHQTLY